MNEEKFDESQIKDLDGHWHGEYERMGKQKPIL